MASTMGTARGTTQAGFKWISQLRLDKRAGGWGLQMGAKGKKKIEKQRSNSRSCRPFASSVPASPENFVVDWACPMVAGGLNATRK